MSVNETALPLLNSSQQWLMQQRNAQQMEVNRRTIYRNQAKIANDSAQLAIERCEFDISKARQTYDDYLQYLRDSPEQANSALQATSTRLFQKLEDAISRKETAKLKAEDTKTVFDEAERELNFQTARLNKLIEEYRGVLREIERLSQSV